MEGEAMLFGKFANVNAFPVCLGMKELDKIVERVRLVAPAFGGIILEDIVAPRCVGVEEGLRKEPESVGRTAHQTGVARGRRRQEVAPVW